MNLLTNRNRCTDSENLQSPRRKGVKEGQIGSWGQVCTHRYFYKEITRTPLVA